MPTSTSPRDAAQRVEDALAVLQNSDDLWISTAAGDNPWLVPLSFHWTGEAILLATLRRSPTYRNLEHGSTARIAVGQTRDVVMLDGDIELPDELPTDEADATAAVTGYDPRTEPEAAYVRFIPRRAQAWRTAAELEGRTIMRDGIWSAAPEA